MENVCDTMEQFLCRLYLSEYYCMLRPTLQEYVFFDIEKNRQ